MSVACIYGRLGVSEPLLIGFGRSLDGSGHTGDVMIAHANIDNQKYHQASEKHSQSQRMRRPRFALDVNSSNDVGAKDLFSWRMPVALYACMGRLT